MSEQQLPEHIEPIKLAHKGARLHGTMSLKLFPRLAKELNQNKGEVKVTLIFGVDEERYCYLKGHIDTELSLQCQRCLEPLQYKIASDFCLSPVVDDKAADKLPDRYDPLMMTGNSLSLVDLIDEELLLNLPIAVKHDENCSSTIIR